MGNTMLRLTVVLVAVAGLAWTQPTTAPSADAEVAARKTTGSTVLLP